MALRSIDPLYEVLPIFSFLQEDLVALGLDLLELHLHSCTKEPHDEPGQNQGKVRHLYRNTTL
jgi:hypothetical protein